MIFYQFATRMLFCFGSVVRGVFAEDMAPEVFEPSPPEATPIVQTHHREGRFVSECGPEFAQASEVVQQLLCDFERNAWHAHQLPDVHAGDVLFAFAN